MRAAIAQRPILRLMLPTGCTRAGPVAQRLEPAAHNGLVGGSIPSRPTNVFKGLRSFSAVTEFQRTFWPTETTPSLFSFPTDRQRGLVLTVGSEMPVMLDDH
jgi:hypothetical protein